METINSYLDQATQLLGKIYGLPSVMLVFLSCIGVGFVIKRWFKWIPNDAIPAIVPLWGMGFMLLIADSKTDALPFRIWLGKNALVGFIVGIIAILVHRYAIKPLFKKLHMQSPDDNSNPAAFVKPPEPKP